MAYLVMDGQLLGGTTWRYVFSNFDHMSGVDVFLTATKRGKYCNLVLYNLRQASSLNDFLHTHGFVLTRV
jgi:hypothetical protein